MAQWHNGQSKTGPMKCGLKKQLISSCSGHSFPFLAYADRRIRQQLTLSSEDDDVISCLCTTLRYIPQLNTTFSGCDVIFSGAPSTRYRQSALLAYPWVADMVISLRRQLWVEKALSLHEVLYRPSVNRRRMFLGYFSSSERRSKQAGIMAELELFYHVYIAQCIPTRWRRQL